MWLRLGMAFEPEQPFKHPDGTPIFFEADCFGKKRQERVLAGPFAEMDDTRRKLCRLPQFR